MGHDELIGIGDVVLPNRKKLRLETGSELLLRLELVLHHPNNALLQSLHLPHDDHLNAHNEVVAVQKDLLRSRRNTAIGMDPEDFGENGVQGLLNPLHLSEEQQSDFHGLAVLDKLVDEDLAAKKQETNIGDALRFSQFSQNRIDQGLCNLKHVQIAIDDDLLHYNSNTNRRDHNKAANLRNEPYHVP